LPSVSPRTDLPHSNLIRMHPTKEQIIEALKGVQDPELQTDIYSLGCMAYEILTGIRAIHLKDTSADSYFAYLRNVEKPVPTYRVGTIVPELPEVVEQVIHRALVRDLTARYSSVMDFRNAFLSAAGPYLDRQASMSVDLTTSSNVSGFVRKDPDEIAKKSGLGGRLLLRFKKP